MPRYKRIALDVDGVLADFCWEFTKILHDLDPSQYRRHGDQVYSYDFGADKRTLSLAWDTVKQSENWWETLAPLCSWETARWVQGLVVAGTVIFITSRIPTRGDPPREQTIRWLRRHNFLPKDGPAPVFIARRKDKAKVMEQEGVDAIVEDSPDVMREVLKAGKDVIVRDWPYNRSVILPRINSLLQLERFLEKGGAR